MEGLTEFQKKTYNSIPSLVGYPQPFLHSMEVVSAFLSLFHRFCLSFLQAIFVLPLPTA